MNFNAPIIAAVLDYSRESGLAPSTITRKAVGNSRLFARLERGGWCSPQTARRLLTYIASHRSAPVPASDARGSCLTEEEHTVSATETVEFLTKEQ